MAIFSWIKPRLHRWVRTCIAIAVGCMFLATAGAVTTLGPYTFAFPKAQHLSESNTLTAGLNSFAFLSSVGGVAFGGVATGEDGWKAADLHYDASKADGQRLQVVLLSAKGERRSVSSSLMDWQMVPIARFAAAKQHSAFTLFGRLLDREDERKRLARGERIMNYHPALADTLVGLRIMQADILILLPAAADLPMDIKKHVLGNGEPNPDVGANLEALQQVRANLAKFGAQPFQSYVICDHQQEIRFNIGKGDTLQITGEPYWYCWRAKVRGPEFQDAQKKANQEANRLLREESKRDATVLSAAELRAKYTEKYQQERFRQLIDKELEPILQALPEYSKALTAEIRKAGGVNPTVYKNLTLTMQYAALFRHVQQEDAKAYEAFVSRLQNVAVHPEVKTPTALIPPK